MDVFVSWGLDRKKGFGVWRGDQLVHFIPLRSLRVGDRNAEDLIFPDLQGSPRDKQFFIEPGPLLFRAHIEG